jgi:ubiquitin-conjugating enzyme E2 variant
MAEGQHKELAGGYSKTQRAVETVALVVFAGIEVYLLSGLIGALIPAHVVVLPVAMLLGYLGADFLSGMVHWFCDTWGSISWPLVGQTVLRTFREHHFDSKAITRHDFVETNGSNAAIGMVPMLCTLPLTPQESLWSWGAVLCGCTMSFFILMTSQIHKWAHSDEPPRPVAFLQRWNLILSPQHHDKHHTAPFTRNYCITAGWLNPVAEYFRVFPRLERLITLTTGVEPRKDPLSDQLIAELLRRLPPKAPLDATEVSASVEASAAVPQPRHP